MKSTNKKMLKLVSASSLALTLTLAVQNNLTNHQTDNQTQVVQAATSQVNDYIKAKGFANPAINISASTFTSDGTYRYGRPEGVVIHETANPTSTIYNEVSYMKNNWDNIGAYVHAFVDGSQVIQIHNPGRSVWGAGVVANKRYIQIELVREKTFDGFARSVNNDAYYVASLLKTYNLPVDSAEYDGAGTVWSHNAVSKFLGGTNHTDPVGYFSTWGYSMDQFIDLVSQKYQALGGNTSSQSPTPAPTPTPTPSNTVSQYGATEKQYTIKSGTAGYLYTLSSDNKFSQSSLASSLANGQIYSTNTKATYNGETYSLLKNSSNVPFTWIKDVDLVEYIKNQDPITSQTGTSLLGTINAGQPIYQYTDEGYKSTTSATSQATLTLTTKAVTKSGKTYYLATLNGQNYGWVSDASLSIVKPEVSSFNSPVTVNGNQPVYYLTGTGFGNAGYSNSLSDIAQITQKATYNGQTYYLLSNSQGSPLAWINSNGVSLKAKPKPVLSDFASNATIKGGYNTYYLTNNGFTNAGNSSQLTSINRVLQKATLEDQTYYLVGNGSTPIAWINESGVTLQSNTPAPTPEKPSISSFSMSNIQVAANQPAYYLVNNSFSDAGQKSQDFSATQVTQKATYANKTYYLLADSSGTPVVWVPADAVSQKANPTPQPQNNQPTYSDVDQAASLNSNYKTYYMMDSGLVDSGMLTQSVSSAKRVIKKAQIDSKTYYLVSDGQSPLIWVAEAGVNFNTTTNTTPQKPTVSQLTPQNITLKGNQNAYYLMDSFVDAGGTSQFVNLAKQVTAKVNYNNQNYYLVSDGQSPLAWVPESAVSFSSNTNNTASTKPTASQYTLSDVNQSATIQSNYKIYYLMPEGMVEGGLSQNLQNANSVVKKATYNNQTYYLVSDGQSPLAWISSQGVTLKSNTNSSQQNITPTSGIVTINYPNASIAIWDKPASSTIDGRYLPHDSQWQIFAKQTTADGRVWYCVGTDQWIDAQYTTLAN